MQSPDHQAGSEEHHPLRQQRGRMERAPALRPQTSELLGLKVGRTVQYKVLYNNSLPPSRDRVRRRRARGETVDSAMMSLPTSLGVLLLCTTPLAGQTPEPRAVDLDHIILATADLSRGIEEFARLTGVTPRRGGRHPGLGTENALIGLGSGHYLELLAPIVPQADSAPVRLIPAGWALHTKSLTDLLGRVRGAGFQVLGPIPGSRRTPDNTLLEWRTASTGGPGLEAAPFFIEWAVSTPHPSTTSPAGCHAASFELVAPDTTRLQSLLRTVGFETEVRPGGSPALRLTLECPKGRVVFSSERP